MLILGAIKNSFIVLLVTLAICAQESFFYVNDFLLFGLFLSILFLNFIIHPKWSFVNLLSIITILLNIVGAFAIEHSTTSYYLYEVEQWISYEGSIPLLFLYQLFFLLGIRACIGEGTIDRLTVGAINYKQFFLWMLYALLIVTYIVILKNKPAPLLGVDRFVYDKEILGIFGQVTNVLFYFSLGLGILFFKEKKKFYLFLLLLIQVAFLLKGHKFWNLVEVFFLFFLPYAMYLIRRKVLRLFCVIGIGLGALIIAAVSINVYYFPSFEPMDYLRQRLSQEGQLWWSTYKNYPDEIRMGEITKELSIYLNHNSINQYDVGMYKVMQLNTTPERFEWKIDKLSRFTYSTPALVYYHLGSYAGIVFMGVLGLLFGWWFKLVFYSIATGDLLMALVGSRLFYIIRKAVKDGDLYKLFSTEFLIIIVAVLILYLLSRYGSVFSRRDSALQAT